MKPGLNQTVKGLLLSMSVGFSLGCITWLTGFNDEAPIWLAIGSGLFYLHMRWLKAINNPKNKTRIKSLT